MEDLSGKDLFIKVCEFRVRNTFGYPNGPDVVEVLKRDLKTVGRYRGSTLYTIKEVYVINRITVTLVKNIEPPCCASNCRLGKYMAVRENGDEIVVVHHGKRGWEYWPDKS